MSFIRYLKMTMPIATAAGSLMAMLLSYYTLGLICGICSVIFYAISLKETIEVVTLADKEIP